MEADQQAMSVVKGILMRAFGHPTGILGRLGGIIMARTNQRMAQRAIALLTVQPSDRVLEMGFGPGVGMQLLASAVSSGGVVGIDPSEEMVEQATARNASGIGTGRVALLRGSVERLPFKNATFDKALAINSMQVWPDAVTGLREMTKMPSHPWYHGATFSSGRKKFKGKIPRSIGVLGQYTPKGAVLTP